MSNGLDILKRRMIKLREELNSRRPKAYPRPWLTEGNGDPEHQMREQDARDAEYERQLRREGK